MSLVEYLCHHTDYGFNLNQFLSKSQFTFLNRSIYKFNKTVLLRERKRQEAYRPRVASARYAALSPDRGGGYPIQSWLGGGLYPIQSWTGGGYPHPVPTGGTPIQSQGYPHPVPIGGGVPHPFLDRGGTPIRYPPVLT